jgi:hypothetical protein
MPHNGSADYLRSPPQKVDREDTVSSPDCTRDSRGSSATGPDGRSQRVKLPVWFRNLLCSIPPSRGWRTRSSLIIEVELGFIDEFEPLLDIEPVGVALPKGSDSNGQLLSVRFGEHTTENCSANPTVLVIRVDVEMVKQEVAAFVLKNDEPDALAADFDMTRMFRVERREKSGPRAIRVKSTDALQALAHRQDAQIGKRGRVIGRARGEEQVGHGFS